MPSIASCPHAYGVGAASTCTFAYWRFAPWLALNGQPPSTYQLTVVPYWVGSLTLPRKVLNRATTPPVSGELAVWQSIGTPGPAGAQKPPCIALSWCEQR